MLTIGESRLYLGDCREGLRDIAEPFAVVTDPPWDQAKGIPGADDPRGLFAAVVPHLARALTVVVQLGAYTDPCFLSPLAERMSYLHTCWLRYVPPSYNGRILVDADVAYVYGAAPPSEPGRRVLPSTCTSTSRLPSERPFLRRHGRNRSAAKSAETTAALAHPMIRHLNHVVWLVKWHTQPGDLVVDPFMGSGTTAVACVQTGRRFIGWECCRRYFDVAKRRVREAEGHGSLFPPRRQRQSLFAAVGNGEGA